MLIDPTIEMNDIIDFTNTPTLDIINFTNTIDLTDLTNDTPALVDTLLGFSVDVNDPNLSLTAEQLAALTADARFAANDWLSYFDNKGVIDIEINIQKTVSGHPADGKAAFYVPDHTVTIDTVEGPFAFEQTWNVLQAGTLSEMITGVDPNGDAPDMIINIDPDFAKGSFLAPDPSFVEPYDFSTRGNPEGKADMISLLLHEMGHGFGIHSFRDMATGALPSEVSPGLISYTETTFDQFIELHGDGTAWFTGANAQQVWGDEIAWRDHTPQGETMLPVEITTLQNGEQYSHFGNTVAFGLWGVAGNDLMGGVVQPLGFLQEISELDIAVMKDMGAPVIVPVVPVELQLVDFIGIHNSAIDAILG